jgi:serine/threonine protein kinase
MGEVYRGRDPRLGRNVALKILPEDIARDPVRRARFEQEARTVAALNHPNILSVHDVGVENGISYMVTELVEGETLRRRTVPPRKALEIAAQTADGLAAAHSAKVTHRDLKPESVMLTSDGRVKILDFGLAKASAPASPGEAAETQTEAGVIVGTPGYMSPEQVRGAPVDHRSDLFSFGVLLYEILSGKRPFLGATSADVMSAILRDDPPPIPAAVPEAAVHIVHRCLEKSPDERFQSARDLAFALREAAGGPALASGSMPAAPPRRAMAKRNLMIGAAAQCKFHFDAASAAFCSSRRAPARMLSMA